VLRQVVTDQPNGPFGLDDNPVRTAQAGQVAQGAVGTADDQVAGKGGFEGDDQVEAVDQDRSVPEPFRRALRVRPAKIKIRAVRRPLQRRPLPDCQLVMAADKGCGGGHGVSPVEQELQVLLGVPQAFERLW